jgi:protein associated with RNAse G/E
VQLTPRATVTSDITVYKLDSTGQEVWRYPAQVVAHSQTMIKVEAPFNRDDMDLGFATFARGDRFVEFFFRDRWYNIFAVYARDTDVLKGWYCNICRPADISETAVRCEDLALDLWVDPEGQTLVLDRDEFAALDLSVDEQQKGHQALQELQKLAALDQLPR